MTTITEFKYDDGGRSLYFDGIGGDCVARAVSIASRLDYKDVYKRLAFGNATQRKGKHTRSSTHKKRTALYGVDVKRQWFRDYMGKLGFVWVPTMTIGSGCTVHLCSSELPTGRLVVSVSKHYTTMIDGVIHDTYSPQRIEHRPVSVGGVLKTNEWINGNGMVHAETRCVYGYWILHE